MSELEVQDGLLSIPLPNGSSKTFNVKELLFAEAQLADVALASKAKAPYLLDLFNRSMLAARKIATQLLVLKNKAKQNLDQTRSNIILDTVPAYLKEKGGAQRSPYGSEDIREAIVNTQDSYTKALDLYQQIQATEIWLDDYFQAFKNAYFAVQILAREYEPERNV